MDKEKKLVSQRFIAAICGGEADKNLEKFADQKSLKKF